MSTEPRYTASTITDDALDALYERLDAAERQRAESDLDASRAEAAIARVRQIHSRGPRTNACNDCGQPWPCEVARALNTEENSAP